jgi:hypothetical protein
MDIIQPPVAETPDTDNKRHCIRIKARIKIHGEDRLPGPAPYGKLPYQAYCETVTSSRPQSPDVFTTPPTHSEPFQPVQPSIAPTYTARIVTRKRAVSKVSTGTAVSAPPEHETPPTGSTIRTTSDSKHQIEVSRSLLDEASVSTDRHDIVSRTANPRDRRSEGTADIMSRNHTLSRPQVQQANKSPREKPQIILATTPLKQKRYGRIEYHPLPPLPPSPPDTPVNEPTKKHDTNKTTVNFSRGEVKRKSPRLQDDAGVPHLSCIDAYAPPPQLLLAVHHADHPHSATAEHERPPSKSSKRTVTFADDTTLSSRCSSLENYSHIPDQSLQQSQPPASDAQIPSSLRLYRSHDNFPARNNPCLGNDTSASASRRTTPKDFKHKYTFGQRPSFTNTPPNPTVFARPANPDDRRYNPRLSTSKAQYRSLATLPRPLPFSLRVAAPQTSQTGPRHPPWGSLERLDEQRERRVDARERSQAQQFRTQALRAQTLSEATTALGSTDSFGQEAMKREVEGYRAQVVSVYPDMAFDGNAGKGGRRSCCCVVM